MQYLLEDIQADQTKRKTIQQGEDDQAPCGLGHQPLDLDHVPRLPREGNQGQTAPQEAKAEAATPTVEAARPVITAPLIQTRVRTPIDSMAKYTEHKIKAALGSDESKLYITAADDFATNGIGFNPTQYLKL